MSDMEDGGGRGSILPWIPAFILPFVTAGVALVGGVVLGGVAVWVLRPADVRVETKVRDLSPSELDAACGPLIAKVTEDLNRANDQVTTLVGDVKTKEAKVQELETEMKRRGAAGAVMKKQLDTARAELAEAKRQLEVAIQEKEKLVVQLKSALVDLDAQKEKTTEAKQEAYDNGWQAFVNGSQLQVCERGSRKKLGKCREAIVGVLEPLHDDYERCLRTGQAAPVLAEAEKKQEDLPRYAQWLDQDNKVVKGWYIQMCDPTLPEAKDYVPPVRPAEEPHETDVPDVPADPKDKDLPEDER
jgi:hypothetical protein